MKKTKKKVYKHENIMKSRPVILSIMGWAVIFLILLMIYSLVMLFVVEAIFFVSESLHQSLIYFALLIIGYAFAVYYFMRYILIRNMDKLNLISPSLRFNYLGWIVITTIIYASLLTFILTGQFSLSGPGFLNFIIAYVLSRKVKARNEGVDVNPMKRKKARSVMEQLK